MTLQTDRDSWQDECLCWHVCPKPEKRVDATLAAPSPDAAGKP